MRFKNKRTLALVIICVPYLFLAMTYSFMTPAWEANDEVDHVKYVQYIIEHKTVPFIDAANGYESHQPPLYYILIAGWQNLLHIPSFQPQITPAVEGETPQLNNGLSLGLSHDYNKLQQQQAVSVHLLRLPSILFGLGTVIFTFFAAMEFQRSVRLAVASALFVALLPKELVVSSVISNDSLVIMLSTLLLLLILKLNNSPSQLKTKYGLAAGVVGGLAAITKFNSLPTTILLFFGFILVSYIQFRKLHIKTLLYFMLGFFGVTILWFIHNYMNYSDPLAQGVSNAYLRAAIPGLIEPVSWLNTQRFFHFVPGQLLRSAWYNAGWNQLVLPVYIYQLMWTIAALSITGAVLGWKKIQRDKRTRKACVEILTVLAAISGGIALILVAKSALQAEGRIMYVGLAAFAMLCTAGLKTLSLMISPKFGCLSLAIWPIVFLIVNVYIIVTVLLPLHHL